MIVQLTRDEKPTTITIDDAFYDELVEFELSGFTLTATTTLHRSVILRALDTNGVVFKEITVGENTSIANGLTLMQELELSIGILLMAGADYVEAPTEEDCDPWEDAIFEIEWYL